MWKKQPKAYSLEFREEALRRVLEGTTPIRALAQELGVHVETLRNWRRAAQVAGYAVLDQRPQTLAEENRERELLVEPDVRRPAHYASRCHVENHRQVEPALSGGDVRDVRRSAAIEVRMGTYRGSRHASAA